MPLAYPWGIQVENAELYTHPPDAESIAVSLMSYETRDRKFIQLLGLDHNVHVPYSPLHK
eukprot:COSAG05_NODE_2067_length_3615_cov_14.420032_2_plen_60_part_00